MHAHTITLLVALLSVGRATLASLTCPSGTTEVGANEQAGERLSVLCAVEADNCGVVGCLGEVACTCGSNEEEVSTDEVGMTCCDASPCCYPCPKAGSVECSMLSCSFDPPDCGITVYATEDESATLDDTSSALSPSAPGSNVAASSVLESSAAAANVKKWKTALSIGPLAVLVAALTICIES